MKKIITACVLATLALPSLASAMMLDEATTASILGPKMPPSIVRVGHTKTTNYHSVYFFDNIEVLNLTNRVLDRTIRADIVIQQTNLQNGQIYDRNARKEQIAVETHCRARLNADNTPNAGVECGNGMFTRN